MNAQPSASINSIKQTVNNFDDAKTFSSEFCNTVTITNSGVLLRLTKQTHE